MADNTGKLTPEDLDVAKKWAVLRRQGYEAEERAIEALQKRRLLNEITTAQYEKELAQKRQIAAMSAEEVSALEREIDLRKIKIQHQEQEAALFQESIQDLDAYNKKITDAIGFGQKLSSTFSGGWVNAGFALVGFAKKLKALNSGVDATKKKLEMAQKAAMGLSRAGDVIAGSMISRFEAVVMSADKMRSEFYKTTQASEEMAAVMVSSSEKLQHMGLNFELAGKATADLREQSTAFKNANAAAQQSMAVTVGILQQAGVAGATTAKTFDILTKVMGRDIPTATKTLAKFGSIAEALDVSMEQFAKDFGEAAKKLAYNGPKMEKVFIGLQSQARATGISMGRLLDVAGQFDTFEGASEAVSKLNGILGGPYLNSIEMVYMSEEERIKTMRESLKMSGKQWSSMSKFEKLAIANAAGINDMEEATRLFGTSTEEYEKAEKKAASAAKQQKKFAETALKATAIMEKFKHAMNGLVIAFGPALEHVVKLVEGFSNWVKGMSEAEKKSAFLKIVFVGFALKTIGMMIAMAIQAKLTAMAMGGLALPPGSAAATGKGLGFLSKGWNLLTGVMKGAWQMIITLMGTLGKLGASMLKGLLPALRALAGGFGKLGAQLLRGLLPALKALAGGFTGTVGIIVIAVTGLFVLLYNLSDDFKRWVNQFAEYIENLFPNMVDSMSRKIESSIQTIRDFFPGSPIKAGPLMDIEEAGEAIPDMLSKGVAKGIKVKVIPRMEELAMHQKLSTTNIAASAGGTTTLTPSRTQTQSQQPVQLVIDYKGVKRLLGEISTDLLEDAVGLRLA